MTTLRFLIPLACSGILAAPALAQNGTPSRQDGAQAQALGEAPATDAFGLVVPALRAAANVATDPGARPSTVSGLNVWAQQYGWGTSRSIGEAASHGIRGWGAMGGIELAAGRRDYIGISGGFFRSDAPIGAGPGRDRVRVLEGAVHWRRDWGGLESAVRLAAGRLASTPDGTDGSADAGRARRNLLLSASGTVRRDYPIARRLRLTPALAADYYRLAGSNAEGRAQSAVTGTLGLGYELGSMAQDAAWLRLDLQGGARAILLDRFGAGDAALAQRGGPLARLRLSGGREAFSLSGEVSAERQREGTGIALRLGGRLSW